MPFAKRLEECLTARLEAARTQGLLRSSATCLDGAFGNSNSAYPVSFMSNDYLGLARDAEQKKLVAKAFARGRTSASASRLAGGQTSERQRCEEDIAVFFGHEKATLFPCGFMANQAIVSALVARDQTVFADKSMHASTMRALAATHCRLAGFRHLDLEHLERRLRKAAGPRQPIVFTESVFSMDGACADVDGLMELKKKYDFFLVADEAHAVGVLGADGRGCFWQKGADVVIGTFGKALGFFGAVVLSTTTIAGIRSRGGG